MNIFKGMDHISMASAGIDIYVLQDFFDGKPTPLVMKAPWAQAIVIVGEYDNYHTKNHQTQIDIPN